MNHDLEDEIKNNPAINRTPSGSGFFNLRCPICQSKEKKAGFKFEGDTIVFNCFRGSCDSTTSYTYGEPMFRKFRNLMEVMGVSVPLELLVAKTNKAVVKVDLPLIYETHHYKHIELLDDFVRFDAEKHWWFKKLLDDRKVDFNREIYVGTEDMWKNKLIVPCFHNNKLIGWQGINYHNGRTFYLTSSENSDIMFINNPEGRIVKNPIVVEGLMDAAVIPDAIATLKNYITRRQAYILRNSNPILLPDRTGSQFLKSAALYDWRVTLPEWKHKDSNSAAQAYGKFSTAKMIHDGIQPNLIRAEALFKMWRR